MANAQALEAYRSLPIPDTTEEHWRFTDLKGFDPESFAGKPGSVEIETMLDLDVAGYASVTQDGIAVRPLDSAVLRLALALWGALWPIAIAFLIFGRPPVYANAGNARPQSG